MIPFKKTFQHLREDLSIFPYVTKFVIHDHQSKRRHFDLRIAHDNALKSWAIPKAKLPENNEKLLLIPMPDHDIEYINFEGTIPRGKYGAGDVKIYDSGECVIYYWSDVRIVCKFQGRRIIGKYVIVNTSTDSCIMMKVKKSTNDVSEVNK